MRVKSIARLKLEAGENGRSTLKRSLGARNLMAIGLAMTVGAGLFSITGIAATGNSSPAIVLSFVLAALACFFCALCYTEFASMVPVAGSAYTYTYATLGELFAWMVGWSLLLEFSAVGITAAISWSHYLEQLLEAAGIYIPVRWRLSPFESVTLADGSHIKGWINLPAVLIVCGLTMVIIRGIKGSALFNTVLVIVKVGLLFALVICAWSFFHKGDLQPLIPPDTGSFDGYGRSGIFHSAGWVFFLLIGFDTVATLAQETKNPQRNLPLGIIGSLVLCSLLFILFSFTLGITHYGEDKNAAMPVFQSIQKTAYTWLNQAGIVAMLTGYTSVILVILTGQSRLFFSMSRDGLLPPVFSKVHPQFRTPLKANLIIGAAIALLAGLLPVRVAGELTGMGTLLAFIVVCTSVIILRVKKPYAPRSFHSPLVPYIPMAGIACCTAVMFSLPGNAWLGWLLWLLLGLVIYYSYSRRKSKWTETCIPRDKAQFIP